MLITWLIIVTVIRSGPPQSVCLVIEISVPLKFSRTHNIKQLKIWNSFQDKIVFALGFISHKLNSHAMPVFLITWGFASSLQTRYPACAEKHYVCFQGMVPTKAWCWAPHESVVEVGQASSSIQLIEFEKMPVCDMLD